MSDAAFLDGYNPNAFDRPSVTVDLVLLGVPDDVPTALLLQRPAPPQAGFWALPGGFVGMSEGLDETAARILQTKAGIDGARLEQLYTFGAPDRDPRLRVVTVAYLALLEAGAFRAALRANPALLPARIEVPSAGEGGGPVSLLSPDGASLDLAFDHAAILATAIGRLRGKLDYSDVGFALLPELFTLRQLQGVHEAILGTRLNKPAFRRRMLDRGWIAPTGAREAGASFRPAELFRFQPRP